MSTATCLPATTTPTAATRLAGFTSSKGATADGGSATSSSNRRISRGPWNEEKLWYPAFDGQAAYIVPPIANLADGPSGLTYDPGVSLLPAQFKNHFFLVDFRGSSGQSGIRTFSLQPKGASFQLVNPRQFVWSVLATDVDFGPDGALYFSDWVEGWEMTKKGRIYRVLDPSRRDLPHVREVKTLLAEGMAKRPNDALAGLLGPRGHAGSPGGTVRAGRPGRGRHGRHSPGSPAPGRKRCRESTPSGAWDRQAGPSRDGRRTSQWSTLSPCSPIPTPRCAPRQPRSLGDAREPKSFERLVGLLDDASPRVRFFAAIALGKLGRSEAAGPLLKLLRANADNDPYLRHAGVMGLVGSGKSDTWTKAARDCFAGGADGALLAMRRHEDPAIAGFLSDPDPRIVLEAARAINDVPITAALRGLAGVRLTSSATLPLLRRALNANFRLGQAENAAVLAESAARSDLPAGARVLALEMLAMWAQPSGRDRVMGLWRPIPPRPSQPAADAPSAQAGRRSGFDSYYGANGGRCRHRGAWHQGGWRHVGDARGRSGAARQNPGRGLESPGSTG